jgi:hypothetical protein
MKGQQRVMLQACRFESKEEIKGNIERIFLRTELNDIST